MHEPARTGSPSSSSSNEADGPIFKIRADPRLTRVGQYLRRWSIDELPTLNVFRGDRAWSVLAPISPRGREYEEWPPAPD
jgi:lipopolysaccharide/colanic/teichoic acid biosynthesis glycosyltransferase